MTEGIYHSPNFLPVGSCTCGLVCRFRNNPEDHPVLDIETSTRPERTSAAPTIPAVVDNKNNDKDHDDDHSHGDDDHGHGHGHGHGHDDTDPFQKPERSLLGGHGHSHGGSTGPKATGAEGVAVEQATCVALGANLILFIAAITACILANSPVVLVAASIDATLDLGISLLLQSAAQKINRYNPTIYPRGRKMLEPVIVICFAAITCTLTVTVIIESTKELINLDAVTTPTIDLPVIICFIISALVNIILFIYYWWMYTKSGSAAVKACEYQ